MATTPRTSAAGHTLPGSKLRRVTEHIQAHLDQDLTLAHLGAEQSIAEVSRLVGFRTPSHFTTVLRDVLGVTPEAYRAAAVPEAPPRHEGG
jgi:methylphosphotriester-DNA--protein-cysteine methyltransferase